MFSCESGEPAGDDYGAAELQVLSAIRSAARAMRLPAELMPPDRWPEAPPGSQIFEALEGWAVTCPLPLVLFLDEIDALRGNALRSVLRQLRDGFQLRPYAFPASVVLCGLRDVRDYKAASGGDPSRLGTASPFNIAVRSIAAWDDLPSSGNGSSGGRQRGAPRGPREVGRRLLHDHGRARAVHLLGRSVRPGRRADPGRRAPHADAFGLALGSKIQGRQRVPSDSPDSLGLAALALLDRS